MDVLVPSGVDVLANYESLVREWATFPDPEARELIRLTFFQT